MANSYKFQLILVFIIGFNSIVFSQEEFVKDKCDFPIYVSRVDTTRIELLPNLDLSFIKYPEIIDSIKLNDSIITKMSIFYFKGSDIYHLYKYYENGYENIVIQNDSVTLYELRDYSICNNIRISINKSDSINISEFNCSYNRKDKCFKKTYIDKELNTWNMYIPTKFIKEEFRYNKTNTLTNYWTMMRDLDGSWLIDGDLNFLNDTTKTKSDK